MAIDGELLKKFAEWIAWYDSYGLTGNPRMPISIDPYDAASHIEMLREVEARLKEKVEHGG